MKLPFNLRKRSVPLVRQSIDAAEGDNSSNTAMLPAKSTLLQRLQKGKKAGKGKKGSQKKRIVAGVLIVAVAGGIAAHFLLPKQDETAATFTEETVTKHDIQNVLSATGTLEPLDQYNVTARVTGDVLQCTFEEGDVVEKDQLLYVIDSSDVEDNISRSQISVEQSRLNYEQQLENLADLTVSAKKSGVITDIAVEKGDKVSNGQTIATARDSSTMKINLPFNSADAQTFSVGQSAVVTMDSSFETLNGTVTEIDGTDTVLEGNQLVRYVEITVTNPGALSTSASGAATINGIACNGGANFTYNEEFNIVAETSGDVTWVISKGQSVSNGTAVAKLASTDLQNQVKNSQLSLQNSELALKSTVDSLDDYQIKAPIAGTIVTKNTKLGDSLDNTNGQNTLAVIYDMSALTFDIALDELDVKQVSVGQKVDVTVDALDGEEFTGYITNISVAGTTNNGATTYPVTVQIDNPPENLYPGMNVDASIIVEEANAVIAVPVAAVQRGDTVYVKDTAGSSKNEKTKSQAAEKQNTDDKHTEDAKTAEKDADTPPMNTVPDGYHTVTVQTGISDDNYIEITSGIAEGDIVYVPQVVRSSSNNEQGMMMMGGGDMGGGPGGGPGGGGPGGGPGGGGPGGGGMP